jgi:hypothetical protein
MSFDASERAVASGFKTLRGHFYNDERSGEALVEAPDGSLCHLTWLTADDIGFRSVSASAAFDVLPPPDGWDEYLSRRTPEDIMHAEETRRALPYDPIYFNLPDIETQWQAWRVAQAE